MLNLYFKNKLINAISTSDLYLKTLDIYISGMVKKCGLLKMTHDQFKKGKGDNAVLTEFVHSFETAIENNKELESMVGKNQVSHMTNSRMAREITLC